MPSPQPPQRTPSPAQTPPLAKRTPYASDLTDQQWELIADLVPAAVHHPNLQSPVHMRREVVNAILYLTRAGCQWRNLPHDFPPWQTVYTYFANWKSEGVLDAILDRLRVAARLAAGRKSTPTLGIIDSQSAKTTEATAERDRGFDAGKKVKGRKRHILVDVCGIMLAVIVTAANVQDRDGAVPLIHAAHRLFPTITKILVDGAYVGEVIGQAEAATGIDVEVTKRNEQVRGFVPVRLRWAVERTFGWIGRYRRTSKDYERRCDTEEAVIKWTTIAMLLRRLAPSGGADSIDERYA
jgi:putative transposase